MAQIVPTGIEACKFNISEHQYHHHHRCHHHQNCHHIIIIIDIMIIMLIFIIMRDFKEDTWGSARSPDLFEPAMIPDKSELMMMMMMIYVS